MWEMRNQRPSRSEEVRVYPSAVRARQPSAGSNLAARNGDGTVKMRQNRLSPYRWELETGDLLRGLDRFGLLETLQQLSSQHLTEHFLERRYIDLASRFPSFVS